MILVEYEDLVTCPVCGKKMKYINNSHLRSHGYSTESEFLKDYPDSVLRSRSVSDNTSSHLRDLNSNSELQSMKAKNGWTDERRKQKSDQMKDLSYHFHRDDKYSQARSIIYKNRYGKKSKYTRPDGSVLNCRSKLEWDICLFLDRNNIEYQYETLQIPYERSDGTIHKYIPDFYLPKYNLILEGKYSGEVVSDIVQRKYKASIDLGYKYIFIDEYLIKDYDRVLNIIKKEGNDYG